MIGGRVFAISSRLASLSVDGTHSVYGYDPQGNMTRDGAWNLDLEYNMIDRAQNVKQDGVTLANYSYLWDGTKLSTLKGDGTGLVYLGSLVYKKSGNTLSAESIAFSGGRIAATTAGTTTTYTPNYHVTDHLGSVRVVVDENGTVLERSDYYPYGLRWDNATLTAPANRYRYNGKEEQAFAGLPYIDYGARQYDPKFRLAWNGSDPMAQATPHIGTQVFCGGNPVNRIDPNGMYFLEDEWEINQNGEIINRIKTKEHDAFYMVSKVDEQWQRSGQELVFEYGTVEDVRRPSKTFSDGAGGYIERRLTIFEMKGDKNASKLFEFMANPGTTTNVEWTHAKVGTESSGRNIVGTSHSQSSTSVGGYLLNEKFTLREVNHNHPSGAPIPSGGDMQNVGIYKKYHPNVKLNIYVPSSGYSPYNASGTLDSRVTKLPDGSYILPDGRHVRTR